MSVIIYLLLGAFGYLICAAFTVALCRAAKDGDEAIARMRMRMRRGGRP